MYYPKEYCIYRIVWKSELKSVFVQDDWLYDPESYNELLSSRRRLYPELSEQEENGENEEEMPLSKGNLLT